MDNTLNNTGSDKNKEYLKAWMESHPQEYGEMAMAIQQRQYIEDCQTLTKILICQNNLLILRSNSVNCKM